MQWILYSNSQIIHNNWFKNKFSLPILLIHVSLKRPQHGNSWPVKKTLLGLQALFAYLIIYFVFIVTIWCLYLLKDNNYLYIISKDENRNPKHRPLIVSWCTENQAFCIDQIWFSMRSYAPYCTFNVKNFRDHTLSISHKILK